MAYDPKLWEDFPKTEQECFDRVAEHLLTQNARALLESKCAYRSHGKKCAAGCLIPDAAYSVLFEDRQWSFLVSESLVPSTHVDLIHELQEIHDSVCPTEWKTWLKAMASTRGLKCNFENFEKENPSA